MCIGRIQDSGEIHLLCAFRDQVVLLLQAVGAANHFRHTSEAEGSHDLAKLLRNEPHEVHDVFRLSGKTFAQRFVLRCNADRAGILAAHAHHHAAHADKRCRRKAEFLRSKEGSDCDIPAAHKLAVRLNANAVAKTILQEGLMCFRNAELPRKAGIVNGRNRSCSRSSVIAGNQNDLGTCLCHAACNRADSCFRNQLHGNSCVTVCILQIIDQLCQILDRINVMVRRRRNQRNAGCGITGSCNPGINLLSGKMAAFTGLCPLCHFDLDLHGAVQVLRGHSEAAGGHLLDGRIPLGSES